MTAGPAPTVVVAVLTYRRPDDLAAALPALVEQARAYGDRASVLAVDNDPDGGAAEAVAAADAGVRYVHEPTPGIAAARNAALDAAVEAEFDARLPLIVTQEIMSSAGKAAATWAASQAAYQQDSTAGVLVQIVGIAYQAASTAADLRAWTTMPKQVALLRVPTPADGALEVRAGGAEAQPGRTLCTLAVAPGAPNIVHMSLPSAAAPHPAVLQYRGGGGSAIAPGPPAAAAPGSPPTPAATGDSP